MDAYPRTLAEFDDWFSSEETCRLYIAKLRWPNGFQCSRCATSRGWVTDRSLIACPNCGYQASITAGTIFHKSHLPLRAWFRAMWWVTNQKGGISALGLQRLLALGSYRTAWSMLQKLRRAMVRPGREKLSGKVEVDETFVGGVDVNVQGREPGSKALVVVATEVDGDGIGRIRMRSVRNASEQVLTTFVKDTIEVGSVVITDGWAAYETLSQKGFKHKPRIIGSNLKMASKLLPRVHRVISLLKRWLLGTHQGAVSRKQLDAYLDEFTFRFNRRTSMHRGKLFYRLVQQAVAVSPAPYPTLIADPHPHR